MSDATSTQEHPDTIGTVEHDGRTFEIDWCHDLDDDTARDPHIAVVYLDGQQIADLPLPGLGEPFTSIEQVMQIAREEITSGRLDIDARTRLPIHRTDAGTEHCSVCDGGGCLDCTDPA